MENSRKQTNIFGYSISCNCRKRKHSAGVINHFFNISKLPSCVPLTQIWAVLSPRILLCVYKFLISCASCVYHWYMLARAQRQMCSRVHQKLLSGLMTCPVFPIKWLCIQKFTFPITSTLLVLMTYQVFTWGCCWWRLLLYKAGSEH